MNADDLAVKLYAELRKHPHDAREFIRGMLEQMSTAELAEIIGSSNAANFGAAPDSKTMPRISRDLTSAEQKVAAHWSPRALHPVTSR